MSAVSPSLQALVSAVSSPLLVASIGDGGAVQAANELALQLLRPDTAAARADMLGVVGVPLLELLEVVNGDLQPECIADCTVRLPSGGLVAVKCDCRRCPLPGHGDLLFINLWPGVTEPQEDEEPDGPELEEEAVALNQVKIQSLNILRAHAVELQLYGKVHALLVHEVREGLGAEAAQPERRLR